MGGRELRGYFPAHLDRQAICSLVFLAALTIRFVFAVQWNATPYGAAPILDARAYDDWARAIAQGEFLRHRAFYQSPLYPYLLGLLYKIAGPDYVIVSLLNAVLGAGACAAISWFSFRFFGPAAALAAGMLAAFDRSWIFFTGPVMKESLALCLLALFLADIGGGLMADAASPKLSWRFFRSGLWLGLCALVRGNVILLAAAIPALLWLWRRPALWKKGALFGLGVFLAILPATLHNAIASHDFVPINYGDGFNFYIGNSPAATGISYAFPPGIASDPKLEESDITLAADRALGYDARPSEVSRFWRNRALAFIIANPAHCGALLWKKLLAFWNNADPFDNYDLAFIEKNFHTLLGWPLVDFWLVIGLAVFGAVHGWPAQRQAIVALTSFICLYMVSVILFYVTDRYRLPVTVFLFPLAGAGLAHLLELRAGFAQPRFWAATAAASLAIFFSVAPKLDQQDLRAFDWGTLCAIQSDAGQYPAALEALDKGLAIAPDQVGTEAIIKGSYAQEHLGEPEKAAALLLRAKDLYPFDGSVRYNLGRMEAAQGHIAQARADFADAVTLAPSFTLGYVGLAMADFRLGEQKKAQADIDAGLAVDSADPHLRALQEQIRRSR